MTHQKMISTKWFTQTEIAKAFDISRKSAKLLCDHDSRGVVFSGGYGCNIVEKQGGQDWQAREEAAEQLAHSLPSSSECRACEDALLYY